MSDPATKLAYWREHCHGWEMSGLSQRAYCEREGLSYSSFGYWRQQTRQAAGLVALPTPHQPCKLVPIQIASESRAHNASADNHVALPDAVRLQSPAGWQITLPHSVDLCSLARLLQQLP